MINHPFPPPDNMTWQGLDKKICHYVSLWLINQPVVKNN